MVFLAIFAAITARNLSADLSGGSAAHTGFAIVVSNLVSRNRTVLSNGLIVAIVKIF